MARLRRYGSSHHAEQGLPFIENLLHDLRYAVRMLLRSPGFAFVAIATMALGIGATTAIYSVIDATLLHPLPYPHPAELVRIEDDLPGVGAQRRRHVHPGVERPAELRDFPVCIALRIRRQSNLTGSAQPVRIAFRTVAPNYFAVLGVDAQLGRTFDPHDETPGFNLEVVISDGLWKRAFGADPHILGKTLRLDNDEYHVVGVMPPGFRDQGRPTRSGIPNCGRQPVLPAIRLRLRRAVRVCASWSHRAPEARPLAGGRAAAPRCAGCSLKKQFPPSIPRKPHGRSAWFR